MKKLFVPVLISISAITVLSGCLALQVGGGDKKEAERATVGKQLQDLKVAKDSGAISEAEYESLKAKALSEK
jgi:hypothetical protein